MMLYNAIRLLGAVLLLAGTVSAQPSVAWWENPVGAGLSLTDAQRERIKNIARDFRYRLAQKRGEANRAELELEDVFNAEVVDTQRGQTAIDRLAKARAELIQDVSRMTLQMRTVLTSEQWQSLQSRRSENRSADSDRNQRPAAKGRVFRTPPPVSPYGSAPLQPSR